MSAARSLAVVRAVTPGSKINARAYFFSIACTDRFRSLDLFLENIPTKDSFAILKGWHQQETPVFSFGHDGQKFSKRTDLVVVECFAVQRAAYNLKLFMASDFSPSFVG
jgi:hypothetical protein